MPRPKPLLLLILDGWGYRESPEANAIQAAKTPCWDSLWHNYPHTLLSASGEAVGLPLGQMGNSEVGHLTLGAGRVVSQDLTRISKSLSTGEFSDNLILKQVFVNLKETKAHAPTLHILGLLSPGGVHSHEDHIFALLRSAKAQGVVNIVVHVFLDGRDTPPRSARNSLEALQQLCDSLEGVRIGSVCGRYFAMDRDKRFERTQKAYDLLTMMSAEVTATTALDALAAAYERGESDEFVSPTVIEPASPICSQDAVIFMNFRSDRARQLSYALSDPEFTGFKRKTFPKLSQFITLTEYAKDIKASVLFPPQQITNGVGEFLQSKNLTQLRLAETEKYAHVTFFFNGGREICYTGETRQLIPSPRVSTYDLKPEMSAVEITDYLVEAILNQSYDVIICNFANADMLGHTGNFEASLKAIETLDACLARIIEALEKVQGEALITADHGNAERMFDISTQQPHTAHTTAEVPLIYVGKQGQLALDTGVLADVAPTLIQLMGFSKPVEMTGRSLLIPY